ncbi:MAG: class I SAM-dependent methyltransferase [Planctomycetota bacterium]
MPIGNRPSCNPPPSESDLSEAVWRRGPGISPGTWRYAATSSIADGYDDFVSQTPLCELDQQLVKNTFPTRNRTTDGVVRVVDLGCGTGRITGLLSQRGYDVVPIDLSSQMLQHVARRIREHQLIGVSPIRANLSELGCLSANSCDAAVCLFSTIGMIQGRRHRQEMLDHAARIIKRGGVLLIHVHNRTAALAQTGGFRSLASQWLRSRWNRDVEFGDAIYAYRGLPDMFLHRFTRREIVGALASAGWQCVQINRISLDGATTLTRRWQLAGGYVLHAVNQRD